MFQPVNTNYTDLLDAEKYVVGNTIKDVRWKINDNLPGTISFCPIVRKTTVLKRLLSENITEKIEQLQKEFPSEIFHRATNFLYNKETRSSYEIEKEQPSPDRMAKFIDLLAKAGTEPGATLLDEARLVQLQNAILDPRYAANTFRNFQNYVGAVLPGLRNVIHYVCPPPAFVPSLMKGLKDTEDKTSGIYPEIRASVIAFGFVFIHPFEDGNGRLHRFLIHDILVHDGLVPKGVIIPVSAHMLNNIKDYDQILEKYSKPLMERIRYVFKEDGKIEVTNEDEVETYFRYPDLTDQCIYLLQVIQDTVAQDMHNELLFLQRYDEVKQALQNIVDMPDRDINLMIMFLHQNHGTLPGRRREKFNKLTDDEISRMQEVYRKIFKED